MKYKKSVCFIANHKAPTDIVSKELIYFLGNYIEVKSWCLQNMQIPSDIYNCDLYIASSYTALNRVKNHLSKGKKIIVAERALNTKNLDKILDLKSGTKILVVTNSQETVTNAIYLLEKIGVDYLEFYPYYPDSKNKYPSDINIAITTGLSHLVPTNINKTIDLGIKGLDLSTYVELIVELNLPKELINQISYKYIKEIFNLTIRRQNIAQLNNNLKRRLEVMINTVDESILAINNNQEIILINTALEKLLDINRYTTLGKHINEIFPQLDFTGPLKNSISIVHNIQQIENDYYILDANPIKNDNNLVEGVIATIKPVGKVQELETKVRRELKKQGNIAKYYFRDIIGHSNKLKEITVLAKQFAKTDLTVLIEGESGTGKELYAQAIHNFSNRKYGPFIAVNFAALTENLLESELFGYEEGAFTGAKKGGKPGLFEEAHNGTIFLDEIGDASLEVQKKLLRVLEEREVRRVGGRTVTPIDVRVIGATNQDLGNLVKQGVFRSDLFYRLCTLPISIPPLRDRKNDILTLISYFAQKLYQRNLILDESLKEFLLNYSWPGNIRELENVVKYMCSILTTNETANITHLPLYLTRNQPPKTEIKFENDNKDDFGLIKQELLNQNLLTIVTIILKEIQIFTALNKGLGRSTLLKRLRNQDINNFPDHKLRLLIKRLAKMNLVESGTTKQGTKITSLGNNFLKYLENNK